MNIGIIGAGVLGSTLAKQFVALGYQVNISNSRGPDTLAEVAVLTGASPVTIEDVITSYSIHYTKLYDGSVRRCWNLGSCLLL